MIIYEIKEYLLKDDETLQSKTNEFNMLGFELLTTEKEDGKQKLILRRSKSLIHYNALVKITKEIDELENLIKDYETLKDKRKGLKEIPNIPLKMIRTFSLVSLIVFMVLSVYNLINKSEVMMITFFIISILSLIIFLVLTVKNTKTKNHYEDAVVSLRKKIKEYFIKAEKLEKR